MKSILLAATLLLPVQIDPLDMACPGPVCAIEKERLRELLEAHGQNVERIRHLEAELRNADTSCFLKGLRGA